MNRKRVLCVDDDTGILRALRRMLERKGYEVAACANGKDALVELSNNQADLIILDLMMPGMNGHELLEEIRCTKICDAPVVMLTAQCEGRQIMQGYIKGAVYYITKPFKNKHVMNIVEYLLGDLSESEKQTLELEL